MDSVRLIILINSIDFLEFDDFTIDKLEEKSARKEIDVEDIENRN
jgi:hypothetical protein